MENQIRDQLQEQLLSAGADLVGFADLSQIEESDYPTGISIAIKLSPTLLKDIQDGPTRFYYDEYHRINGKLDRLAELAATFLQSKGFHALALTSNQVVRSPEDRTILPHKTLAVHSGLGWIGKSNLLVTPNFGGAVRLTSVLTDAPLPCGEPKLNSRCGACRSCVDACPGTALKNRLWTVGTDRDEMFDRPSCIQAAQRQCIQNFGIQMDICGQCFVKCPHTIQYLRSVQA